MAAPIEGSGPVAAANAAGAAEARESREAIRAAARGLEAALLREMLTAMERAQLEDGLFGRGPGAGAYQSAFELLLTEALGEREPFGIAERIAGQLAGPDPARGEEGDSAEKPRQARDSAGGRLQEALDLAREGGLSFAQVPIYPDEGSSPGQGGR